MFFKKKKKNLGGNFKNSNLKKYLQETRTYLVVRQLKKNEFELFVHVNENVEKITERFFFKKSITPLQHKSTTSK